MYYAVLSLVSALNPRLDNNGIYNILLIKLNNIKLNFFFVNILLISIKKLTASITQVILVLMFVSVNTAKNFTVVNFYHGYVKIHPNLQYVGSCLLFLKILKKKNESIVQIYTIMYILTIAFVLGSLWALFQSVWGYYWSNDSIEYILIFFIILALGTIHQYYSFKYTNQLIIILILLLLLFIRLNLIYTKHNFFTKTTNLKYFIFFWQIFYLTNYEKQFKNKQQLLNIKNLFLVGVIVSILYNKLNTYFLKILIYIYFGYNIINSIFLIVKNSYKKSLHILVLTASLIYVSCIIKYTTLKVHNNVYYKSKQSFFIFASFNNLVFFKKISNTGYSYLLNSTPTKHLNEINLTKFNKKKLYNYI